MTSTGFELVDALDGAEIDWVDGEAIEGVGWERDDVTGVEAGDDIVDQCWLGFVGMNAECFGRQNLAPVGSVWGGALWVLILRKVFQRRELGSDLEVNPR